ncbi:LYNX1 isoform 1 [Pan troglodytes]|uniref:LYNX1 isoform 1 n=1 Tax=Pan troglodytes TaxID=9598 RepID=A0A2J8LFL0_PANTR|nr:LYNX1 isoform 1 [Pan troglodytes]
MTPLLTLILVVLMGLPLAQALDCHVCAYNGDNCFNPMRCPAMVAYCMTTRTYYTPTRMKLQPKPYGVTSARASEGAPMGPDA